MRVLILIIRGLVRLRSCLVECGEVVIASRCILFILIGYVGEFEDIQFALDVLGGSCI